MGKRQRKAYEATQGDVYLSAWCPKDRAGVRDKAKLRDKERLVVRDETDGFYGGAHIKEVSTLVFSKKRERRIRIPRYELGLTRAVRREFLLPRSMQICFMS